MIDYTTCRLPFQVRKLNGTVFSKGPISRRKPATMRPANVGPVPTGASPALPEHRRRPSAGCSLLDIGSSPDFEPSSAVDAAPDYDTITVEFTGCTILTDGHSLRLRSPNGDETTAAEPTYAQTPVKTISVAPGERFVCYVIGTAYENGGLQINDAEKGTCTETDFCTHCFTGRNERHLWDANKMVFWMPMADRVDVSDGTQHRIIIAPDGSMTAAEAQY